MSDTTTRAGRREWIGLSVLVLPVLLISMDMTVLNLALPRLGEDLAPSSSQLLWILDIYSFLLAGLLIPMGTLGDRIGRRRLLLVGAAAFGVASVAAAYSTSAEMLIATRAVLGIAGATLMPSTLALIRNMFHDPRQRTIAISIWTAGFSLGMAIGPLLGGALLDHFWWGAVFLVAVPPMVLLLALGPVFLPEFRDPRPGRLDPASAVLSLAAVLAVIYGVKKIAEEGLGTLPAVSIVVGLAAGAVFLHRQRTLGDPMIDLALFRARGFGISLAVNTFAMFAMIGFSYFAAQYLQLVLGLQPLTAGLWTLPVAATTMVGATLAASLVRSVRPGILLGIGLGLIAVGFVVMTQVGADSGVTVVVVGLGVAGVGVGIVSALAADMIVAAAPPERAGTASGLSEAGTELGGALGIAILGSIGIAVYRAEVLDNAPVGVPAGALDAAHETLAGAVASAGQLSPEAGGPLLSVARAAFTHGMQTAAVTGAVLMAGLAVLAVVLLRHLPKQAAPATDEPGGQPDAEPSATAADDGRTSAAG